MNNTESIRVSKKFADLMRRKHSEFNNGFARKYLRKGMSFVAFSDLAADKLIESLEAPKPKKRRIQLLPDEFRI